MNYYTGVEVLTVSKESIDELYDKKKVSNVVAYGFDHLMYQNTYVVLKDESGTSSSAIGRVKGNYIHLVPTPEKVSGLKPKNKEQIMALDALMDDSVKVVIMTGKAGCGKTLMATAAALSKYEDRTFQKIIYTRPMSQVTKHDLGTLPGDVEEKFSPYLQGFYCNAEYLVGGKRKNVETMIAQHSIEFLPLQLFRGASFHNSFVIVDESQVCSKSDMLTIGTRLGEGSKLVVMGDLNQRDEKIKRTDTGLFTITQNESMKNSKIVSYVELMKSERGEVSELFAKVFENSEE